MFTCMYLLRISLKFFYIIFNFAFKSVNNNFLFYLLVMIDINQKNGQVNFCRKNPKHSIFIIYG